MTPVAIGVDGSDGLLVELGQQNMCDRPMNGFRSRLQQIGEANMKPSFAQANRGVQRGEAAKADIERRNRSPRAKVSVLLFKDGDECRGHTLTKRLTRRQAK